MDWHHISVLPCSIFAGWARNFKSLQPEIEHNSSNDTHRSTESNLVTSIMQFLFNNSRRQQRFSFNKVLAQCKALRKSPAAQHLAPDRSGNRSAASGESIWQRSTAHRSSAQRSAAQRSAQGQGWGPPESNRRSLGSATRFPIRDQGRLKTQKSCIRPGTCILDTRVLPLANETREGGQRSGRSTKRLNTDLSSSTWCSGPCRSAQPYLLNLLKRSYLLNHPAMEQHNTGLELHSKPV